MNNLQQQVTTIKIVILGPSKAGKTSLLLRLQRDSFKENNFEGLGLDFMIKGMQVNNEPVKLQIWDSNVVQVRKRTAASKIYYKGTHGVVFAFDITSEDSFQEIQKLHEITQEEINKLNQQVQYFLIGCKCDLENERAISQESATAFAGSLGMHYIETSAKMNINCLEAVDQLVLSCYSQIKNQKVEEKPKLVEPHQKNKTTCY